MAMMLFFPPLFRDLVATRLFQHWIVRDNLVAMRWFFFFLDLFGNLVATKSF